MEPDGVEFWDDCPLVGRDPDMRGGEPVLLDEQGLLTRTKVDDVVGSVEAYIEIEGMTEAEAIEATIEDSNFAGGVDTIRKLLAYQEAHLSQLQPS